MMTTQMKKDIHLTGKDLMQMVQLRPEDIGKYAIVPGPKERLDGFLKCIENRRDAAVDHISYWWCGLVISSDPVPGA